MLAFLVSLPESAPDAVTTYLPPGLTRDQAALSLEPATGVLAEEITELVTGSKTGACLFWGPVKRLVFPPFPLKAAATFGGYATAPLLSTLTANRTIAMVLVRLGAYAVGVCRGDTLIVSKVGTGLVHARHRQGGSSSQRFRRHREKQIEQFLIRVCQKVREHLGPYLGSIDYVVYGGAWTTLELLQKYCPLLNALEARSTSQTRDNRSSKPRSTVYGRAVSWHGVRRPDIVLDQS
jgi:hypothetical protein